MLSLGVVFLSGILTFGILIFTLGPFILGFTLGALILTLGALISTLESILGALISTLGALISTLDSTFGALISTLGACTLTFIPFVSISGELKLISSLTPGTTPLIFVSLISSSLTLAFILGAFILIFPHINITTFFKIFP